MAVRDERHSFIVHMWLEKHASRGEGERWRGHVTHVPTGRRRYVQSISEISVFIRTFLDKQASAERE